MSTHSVLRYEAALKVTGSAIYEAEVPAAGLLHAAFVQSPISCGDVSSVDATRAVDLPGFAAMVSYADTEVLQASPATALIRERTVHFAGQPVALVAASSLQEARDAAHAIQVSLEARPAVTALAQALDKSFAPAMVGRFPAATHRGDASRALARPISSSDIDTTPRSTIITLWSRTPLSAGGRAARPWCTRRPRPSSAPVP